MSQDTPKAPAASSAPALASQIKSWTEAARGFERHPEILTREGTVIVIVDFQERLAMTMPDRENVLKNILKLATAAKVLRIPILLTEQYPQGLGPTVVPLQALLAGDYKPHEKLAFSCCGCEGFMKALEGVKRRGVLLVGIEAHVCILQTALDLRHRKYQVHVASDACCSRVEMDWNMALLRMEHSGVLMTTVESAIFQMLERAGTPEFKEILRLVK
jgi:nicotinamidase-related amidase